MGRNTHTTNHFPNVVHILNHFLDGLRVFLRQVLLINSTLLVEEHLVASDLLHNSGKLLGKVLFQGLNLRR